MDIGTNLARTYEALHVDCCVWCFGSGKLLTVVTNAVELCPIHRKPLSLYTFARLVRNTSKCTQHQFTPHKVLQSRTAAVHMRASVRVLTMRCVPCVRACMRSCAIWYGLYDIECKHVSEFAVGHVHALASLRNATRDQTTHVCRGPNAGAPIAQLMHASILSAGNVRMSF